MKQIMHWVPETGLVVNMDPSVANFLVDIVFALLAAATATLGANALVMMRKMAIVKADKRNIPVGRLDAVEVAKEWLVMRSGGFHFSAYTTALGLAVFLILAHAAADLGLTFGRHNMGEERQRKEFVLTERRSPIEFRRDADIKRLQGTVTEGDVIAQGGVPELDLYRKALRAGLKLEVDNVPNGAATYHARYQQYTTEEPTPVLNAPEVHLKWHQPDWFLSNTLNFAINVTQAEQNTDQLRFFRYHYELKAELLDLQGFNPSQDCFLYLLDSPEPKRDQVVLGCRKSESISQYRYFIVSMDCATENVDLSWMFSDCTPETGAAVDFVESIDSKRLLPVPLPIWGSFIAIGLFRRSVAQTRAISMVRTVLNSRIYIAEVEHVQYNAEIIRPELGYVLLSILFVNIMVMVILGAWIYLKYKHVEALDEHVAKAHIPSYPFEWALKARNEKLQEWSCDKAKPKDLEIASFFGVEYQDGDTDHLGLTPNPQPSRRKAFGTTKLVASV